MTLSIHSTPDNLLPAVRKQQEHEAMRHLQQSARRLLDACPADNLYWTGTKTDLMEMAYLVFLFGNLCDAEGCPVTFAGIVSRFCCNLHVAEPRNPRAYVSRARQRKGIRRPSFFDRYCFLLFSGQVSDPLSAMFRTLKNRPAK